MDKNEAKKEIIKILDSCREKSPLEEYQSLCKLTAKKFRTPVEEILTWGLGITGEAGDDVASCIKKTYMHDNDKKEGIRENIGDTLWYAAMICNFFGWSLQEILDENTKKLRERCPDGFKIDNARRNGEMIDWSEDGD
jgi:NTP pyrophosphatase (non-canonical NTP hydrolase)